MLRLLARGYGNLTIKLNSNIKFEPSIFFYVFGIEQAPSAIYLLQKNKIE